MKVTTLDPHVDIIRQSTLLLCLNSLFALTSVNFLTELLC